MPRFLWSLLLSSILLWPSLVQAQDPPNTDLWLLTRSADATSFADATVQRLTTRPGYDNQPSFMPDNRRILYTVVAEGQADTWQYDLATDTATRITATPNNEYSPVVMPSGDTFSVIRQDTVGIQLLWHYDLDGTDRGPVLPGLDPAAYYAWATSTQVVVSVIGPPGSMSLNLVDTETQQPERVAPASGRSIDRIPGTDTVSYVSMSDSTQWMVRQFDVTSGAFSDLMPALNQSMDYAWTPEGQMVSGDGSMLYQRAPGDSSWRPVLDLSAQNLTNITRLAVSPNGRHVVVVAEPVTSQD